VVVILLAVQVDKVVPVLAEEVAGFMFLTVVGRQSMAGLHGECLNKRDKCI
jgi:hypothetical protein